MLSNWHDLHRAEETACDDDGPGLVHDPIIAYHDGWAALHCLDIHLDVTVDVGQSLRLVYGSNHPIVERLCFAPFRDSVFRIRKHMRDE